MPDLNAGQGLSGGFKPPSLDDIRDFIRRNPGDTSPARVKQAFTNITDEEANAAGIFNWDQVLKQHSGGMVPFANWTRAHRGLLAWDEVPAVLQAGEGVVSRRGMAGLGADGLAALNRGRSGGGNGRPIEITVISKLDERQVGEAVVRIMPRILAAHGLRR